MFFNMLTTIRCQVVTLALLSALALLAGALFVQPKVAFMQFSPQGDKTVTTPSSGYVTGVNNPAGGGTVGIFNGTGTSFHSFTGQTAMWNGSTQSWVVNAPLRDGDGGVGGSGAYNGPDIRVSSTCQGMGSWADLTVAVRNRSVANLDYNLFLNGISYSGIDGGGDPKTVSVPHNQTYHIEVRNWSLDLPRWLGGNGGPYRATHTVADCSPPPPHVIPVSSVDPKAEIAVTPMIGIVNSSSYTVSYGNFIGTPASSCELQRRHVASDPDVAVDSNWQPVHSGSQTPNGSKVWHRFNQSPLTKVGDWEYRARCSYGGKTSGWVTAGIRVNHPGPDLTLTAADSEVRYDDTTTLTWDANHTAPVCTASGGWSGSRSPNGTEETSPLTQPNNQFSLTCPAIDSPYAPYAPVIRTVGVSMKYSRCADMEANGGMETILVRKGSTVPIEWNIGTAAPRHCMLKAGDAVIPGAIPAAAPNPAYDADDSLACSEIDGLSGTYQYVANGETVISLECEGLNINQVLIKVLPEFQET